MIRIYSVTIVGGEVYMTDITKEFVFDTCQKNKTMTKTEEEIDRLESEAREAGIEVSRLESRLQAIPTTVDKLQHELNEAKNRRNAAITRLRQLKPVKLPPVPSHDELLAMARKQCPDRDPQVINRLVGQLHANAVTGANSGESVYSRAHEITGNVRSNDDTEFDIQPPPVDASAPVGLPRDPPMPPRPKITYG
jgi:hypothetical protein